MIKKTVFSFIAGIKIVVIEYQVLLNWIKNTNVFVLCDNIVAYSFF